MMYVSMQHSTKWLFVEVRSLAAIFPKAFASKLMFSVISISYSPDKIPISFLGIELDSESSRVTQSFRTVPAMDDSAEPDGDICDLSNLAEQVSGGDITQVKPANKRSLCSNASRVNHAFWNAFAVKVGELFEQVKVLQQHRTSLADCKRTRRVCHWGTSKRGRRPRVKLLSRTVFLRVHVALSDANLLKNESLLKRSDIQTSS
jgi:hypothetical protein